MHRAAVSMRSASAHPFHHCAAQRVIKLCGVELCTHQPKKCTGAVLIISLSTWEMEHLNILMHFTGLALSS